MEDVNSVSNLDTDVSKSSEAGEDQPSNTSAADGTGGDKSSSESAADGGASDQTPPQTEQENEFVKDDQGNEYLPKDKVEAIIQKRLSKMSQQKNDARSAFLESLKNDPSAREELKKLMDLGNAQPEKSKEPVESEFDKWLAPLPPQHQAHYTGLVEAIAPQFEGFVEEQIQKAMQPVLEYIGKSSIDGFKTTNKDADKYMPEMQRLIASGEAKNLAHAYKIASYDDKIKAASMGASKQMDQRNSKLNSLPKSPSKTAINMPKNKFGSMREAIEEAGRELGFK